MKLIKGLFFINLLLTVLLLACESEYDSKYKGGNKLQLPPNFNFPDQDFYDLQRQVSKPLSRKLDSAAQAIVGQLEVTALSATILVPQQGVWQIDTGFADLERQIKVADSTIFYWASVSKVITGIIIQELISQQKLDLNDTLSNWYPDFQLADQITIYDLLHHTSGIYSFNQDSSLLINPKFRTPEELLQIARGKNNLFRPGEYWSYSNTNYLLLALIAEKITDKNYDQLVQDLVSKPYGLTTLRALQPEEVPPNLAYGHTNGEVTTRDYSVPVGAGNVVSNSYDMALLLQKLLTGELFPQSTVHSWLNDLYPMFDQGLYYGQGIMAYSFDEIDQSDKFWIGHSGGTPDYNAILFYDVETQVIVALSINNATPAAAVANVLLQLLK